MFASSFKPPPNPSLRHIASPGRPPSPRARASTVVAASPSGSSSILVADIGGTNCRFQLWDAADADAPCPTAAPLAERVYPTADFARFDQALEAFLSLEPARIAPPPAAAALACAGPVVDHRRCEFTNLGWVVDASDVTQRFGMKCKVLNDFEAVGYGVPALPDAALMPLHPASAVARGPKAVLGPGTGLGQAQLFWDDSTGGYKVHPSEGSHATFAPRGEKQRALQAHVENELGHCSVERVACGSGLVRIYEFLHSSDAAQRPRLQAPTPADVSIAALNGSDPMASEALDMLLEIVGAEASHMALRSLATGGVYIAGGIFPKVIERVTAGGVLEAFLWRASRFHDKVLKHIPLYIVLDDRVGLLGSREQALALAKGRA